MLVITRKQGEKVIIGDSITITLVAIEHGRARLAFEAPKYTIILRAELAKRRDSGRELDPSLVAKPAEWKNASPSPSRRCGDFLTGA